MLRKINLHGALAENGSIQVIDLDVDTTRMMFRGLCSVVDGFESRLRNVGTDIQVFTVNEESKTIDGVAPEALGMTLGKTKEVHITPAIEGGGFEIAIAMGMAAGTMGYFVVGFVINMAISMVLGAISSALAPKPDTSNGAAEKKPSFMFNGPVNVTEQGYPVPLAYGLKVLTGSTVISVDADVVQLPT